MWRRVWIVVMLAATGCVSAAETGGPEVRATTSTISGGPIVVTVELPRSGHADPVDGRAVGPDGQVVEFTLGAGFGFLEPASSENDWRPATSLNEGSDRVQLTLPRAGEYTFTIGQVFFWGGCGTCGEVFGGGSVTASVANGSVVELDLGTMTGAT